MEENEVRVKMSKGMKEALEFVAEIQGWDAETWLRGATYKSFFEYWDAFKTLRHNATETGECERADKAIAS